MKIIDIAILLFFILMIIRDIRIKRKLIIPTSKSHVENIIFLLIISFFIGMTYMGAKTWIHYLLGVLAIIWLTIMWIKIGITTEGFSSMRRGKGIIKWNEISKLTIVITDNIKITITGSFMEEIFYFKRKDYNEILDVIKNKLPIKAKLNIN